MLYFSPLLSYMKLGETNNKKYNKTYVLVKSSFQREATKEMENEHKNASSVSVPRILGDRPIAPNNVMPLVPNYGSRTIHECIPDVYFGQDGKKMHVCCMTDSN